MRVTFLMPLGGMAGGNRVTAIHAAKLAARGHDVHVVWGRRPRPGRLGRLRHLLQKRRPWRLDYGSAYFDDIGVTQHLARQPGIIGDDDVPDGDAVVAGWWETAFFAAALSPAKGRKFYFIQHHEVHPHLPSHISRGSYYLPLKRITISQWLVDTMAQEYGDHDVALVENSVDTDLFTAPPREKNRVPTVGFMYSRKPFKGLDVSLAAIEAARKTVPDLKVIAFGKPAEARGLPEGATYVSNPPQGKIRALYAACDVWLVGSWAEGFHLIPLEAMACRTPVVATRVGGAVDAVTDGVNGHLVDVGDAAALGQRLAEVASLPPEAWRRMSDAALERARAYTWDDAADRFEALISGGGETPLRRVV